MAATEREHQQRAFELYYSLGGKRSHERVAKALRVSVASVKAWSRSFNWVKRLAERDAAVARQVADQTIRTEVDELGRNKKIVQMALIKVARAINTDKVKVQVGDLDRLIRLQTFLDGGSVPPTLDSFNRMAAVDVILLFNEWIKALTDDELRALIAALRIREGGRGNPADDSIGTAFAKNELSNRDDGSIEDVDRIESAPHEPPPDGIPK